MIVHSLALMLGAALLQQPDPYAAIQAAVKQSLSQPQVYVDVSGSVKYGNKTAATYLMRFYIQGQKFILDSYVDDKRRMLVIADGNKVWRYDPIVNEYTFLDEPKDITAAFGVAAAWMRSEAQRPVRLLAASARWLMNPQSEVRPDRVRIFALKPVGAADWRGTEIRFIFDGDYGKLQTYSIEERENAGAGVKKTRFDATFIYTQPFTNVTFAFKPPPGAKPAADLPIRIR